MKALHKPIIQSDGEVLKHTGRNFCKVCFVTFLTTIAVFSCEDFVDIKAPKDQIDRSKVYSNDAIAESAMRGIYSEMAVAYDFTGGNRGVSLLTGLSSDELVTYAGGELDEFYENSLSASNTILENSLWTQGYKFIYYANAVLEGLKNSNQVTPGKRGQLEAEAKFVRAFFNFYLVNLFGKIPLIGTTDYRINSLSTRLSDSEIYASIISDLKEAQNILSENYSPTDGERIRPNKWAVTALLSRVYLYAGDYENAEKEATAVINAPLYTLVENLDDVFLSNSLEAIWQLKCEDGVTNTRDGEAFILEYPAYTAALSSEFVNAFEPGDGRKVSWLGSYDDGSTIYYFPFKYKLVFSDVVIESATVFRLAEQYLIRAEARAKQGKITEAVSDTDVVRNRAGLPLIRDTSPLISQTDLLLAIEQERRIELFTEWGHRWLDLRRTNRANAVLAPLKPDWHATDVLYPVPLKEMDKAPSLKPQNEGY